MLNLVKPQIASVFDEVGTAANVRKAMSQPLHRNNAAFVVPVSNRPMTNSRDVDMGRPIQEFIVTFGVVIGLRAINDPTGEKTLAQLESLRSSLRESLFGWKPDEAHERVILGNGDLIGFTSDGLWWIDRFSTNTWYRGNAT